VKHLHRYLSEFQFRWNNREASDIFTLVVLALLIGKALQYKKLIGKPEGVKPASSESDALDLPF
jgi:hypothetical protein